MVGGASAHMRLIIAPDRAYLPEGLRSAGTDPEGLLDHLRRRGFRICRIEGTLLRSVDSLVDRDLHEGQTKYTNLLATRAG